MSWLPRRPVDFIKLTFAIGGLIAAGVFAYPRIETAWAELDGGQESVTPQEKTIEWIDRPATPTLGRRPLVAFTGIQSRDNIYATQLEAAKWSEPLADLLAASDQARWVERQAVQQAIDEISLTHQLSQDADVLQVGRWARADLVVHAWVDRTPAGPVWDIKVIDTLTAEAVANRTWQPANPEGLLGIDRELDQVMQAISETLAEGITAARDRRESTRLAGLFIENLSPLAYLSEVESAVLSALQQRADQTQGLHLLRFDHTGEAGDEQALAMMGLSDNQDRAWMGVADYYLWGSVNQAREDAQADPDGWELNLQVWDGGNQTREVTVAGSGQHFGADVDRAVRQVLDQLPEQPSKKMDAAFPAILSQRLMNQSSQLRRALITRSAQDQIPTTDWGWRVHAGRQKFNELACFFDPTNSRAWSALLEIKREAMLGDQDQEFPRIMDYIDTRRNALRVAGSSAMNRETPQTIEDVLRKLSGRWGMRGVPEGMTRNHFRPRLKPLIADIIRTTADTKRRPADILLSVLKAYGTNEDRVEASLALWPLIRPDWERRQRQTQGRDRDSSNPRAIDELETRITTLLIRTGREAMVGELFSLAELPEIETKRRSVGRSQPPPVTGYDLRWTPDPKAVFTNQGDITGLSFSDTESGHFARSVEPYSEGLGLSAVALDELSNRVGFFRPMDHQLSLSKQRVPLIVGGEGFSVLIDTPNDGDNSRSASGSITKGSARVGDNDRALAEVLLPGHESLPFALGEAFTAATESTDAAVAGGSIWVSTTTEGVFEYRVSEGQARQYLFEEGLLDRNVPRLLANEEVVVLAYLAQPMFAVKPKEAQVFESLELLNDDREVDLWPEALSGRRVLASQQRGPMLWVVDLQTQRIISLEKALNDFVKRRPSSQRAYFPEVRGFTSDAQYFYLLFDHQLVRLDAQRLTAESWDVPPLDWVDIDSSEGTLWLSAKGPGLAGYPESRSLLLWGWDTAKQRGGGVAYTRWLGEDSLVSVSSDHVWISGRRAATGYSFAALRRAMGLETTELKPVTPASPALLSRSPGWVTMDLSDPDAVRAAAFDQSDIPVIRRIIQHVIANDDAEVLGVLIDRIGIETINRFSSQAFAKQAAEGGARRVIDLWLERVDAQKRRWAAVRVVHGLAASGRDEMLATYLHQALPFSKHGGGMDDPLVSYRFRHSRQTTALEAAAYRGHRSIVALTLPHFESDRFRNNALVLATLGQHPEIVRDLLDAGTDPAGWKFHRSFSAAQIANFLGDQAMLSLFLGHDRDGVIASLSENWFIRNLLSSGQFESVQRLIAIGVNLDQREEQRLMSSDRSVSLRTERTILPISFSNDSKEFWQALIDAGVDFDRGIDRVRLGDLALIQASVYLEPLALSLLDAGYGPDVPDAFGTTPLMAACLQHKPAMIERLLERGADPTRINLDGQSASRLLSEEASAELKQKIATFQPTSSSGVRTMADGAAGPSPMQATRQLRQYILAGDVEAAGALIDFAMIDYDDGAGAGESVLDFAIKRQQPEIAVMIARTDWSLPGDYWNGYHRFNDALERNYTELAQVILNRSGWPATRRANILSASLKTAEANGQDEVVAWLKKQH